MKLGRILDKIGHALDSPIGEAIQTFVPGVAVADKVLDAVNAATGRQLDEKSPVKDMVAAVDGLAPEQAAALQEREIEARIVESNNYAEVAIAQEQNNNATRPQIARDQSAFVIEVGKASFILVALAMVIDAYVVHQGDEAFVLKIVMEGLPWFVGVFVVQSFGVIQQYFARRSDDKRTAMSGTGATPPPASGMLAQIGSMFGRR